MPFEASAHAERYEPTSKKNFVTTNQLPHYFSLDIDISEDSLGLMLALRIKQIVSIKALENDFGIFSHLSRCA
jgi:hypothetical protein